MINYESMRRIRHGLGYTQSELAFILSTSQSFISDIERGKSRLTYAMLKRIASETGESIGVHVTPLGPCEAWLPRVDRMPVYDPKG